MSEPESTKQIGDLGKVLEISRAMVATPDLDALLQLIVDRSMELLDAERATLFLYDNDTDELYSRIAAGSDEIRFQADQGVAGAAVKSGKTINVADAYKDDRFNPQIDRKTGFRTRNILAVGLRDYEGGLVGVLQVLNKRSGAFKSYDITLAETLGAQAGVALQRAKLIDHYIQKQEMERAMCLARDIQRDLLPAGSPAVCGCDVAGFCKPADDTGGDTYDFMPLDDGQWMIVVADATGHGIGPALVISEARAMLRAMSLHEANLATVLGSVNRLLTIDLAQSRFVTCFIGVLDPLIRRFQFASAGHGPMLFYTRTSNSFDEVSATGLPLGIMAESDYGEIVTRELAPGDLAVVTTDGFFEATSPKDEQFGIKRMIDVLRRSRDLPASQIIENLHKAVLTFTKGQPQADDLTAVVIRCK